MTFENIDASDADVDEHVDEPIVGAAADIDVELDLQSMLDKLVHELDATFGGVEIIEITSSRPQLILINAGKQIGVLNLWPRSTQAQCQLCHGKCGLWLSTTDHDTAELKYDLVRWLACAEEGHANAERHALDALGLKRKWEKKLLV